MSEKPHLNGYDHELHESPYGVLKLTRLVATDETVRVAFRIAAARTHPDRPGGSHGAFQRVSRAYTAIRSAESRARYDAWERAQSWYKPCDKCKGEGGLVRSLRPTTPARCSACNGTGLYRYAGTE